MEGERGCLSHCRVMQLSLIRRAWFLGVQLEEAGQSLVDTENPSESLASSFSMLVHWSRVWLRDYLANMTILLQAALGA